MDEERQNPHDDSDKLYELYVKEEEDLSKRELSNVEKSGQSNPLVIKRRSRIIIGIS